jgi:hypothetical protein
MSTRPDYLTQEQLDALPVGSIVYSANSQGWKRVEPRGHTGPSLWRPCTESGRARPGSGSYDSVQLASEGVAR